MASKKTATRQDREDFSSLPQPPQSKKIVPVIEESYLNGLEKYIDALGKHISHIQDEELKKQQEFSKRLAELEKKKPEEIAREQENLRNVFLKETAQIKERRRQFRELLYDATLERRKLWKSMQIQKDDENWLRTRMARLDALSEGSNLKNQWESSKLDKFSVVFLLFEIVFIVLFSVVTEYPDGPSELAHTSPETAIDHWYTFYSHIALLVFVGFGLLFSYLKKFSLSGIGNLLMLIVFSIQWTILVQGFFLNAGRDSEEDNYDWVKISIGFDDLIWGLYGSTTVLVALGAVFGKFSPFHQLLLAGWLIPFFGLNHYIGAHVLDALDPGNTIFIFVFGGAFGVTLAATLSFRNDAKGKNSALVATRYESDILALVGTLFLWVLWPSFNAVFAPAGTQHRVVINTVLALISSAVFTASFSRILRGGKFHPGDIQRASIAGGIAVGSLTSFVVGPGGAMITGAVAGLLATISHIYLQGVLRRGFGYEDTMGVLGIFFVPGLIGALAGIISAGIAVQGENPTIYGVPMPTLFAGNSDDTAGYQAAVLVITVAIAAVSALVLGIILRLTKADSATHFYTDETSWELPRDFEAEVGDNEREAGRNEVKA